MYHYNYLKQTATDAFHSPFKASQDPFHRQVIASFEAIGEPLATRERLIAFLQTTLNPHTLLDIFFSEIKNLLQLTDLTLRWDKSPAEKEIFIQDISALSNTPNRRQKKLYACSFDLFTETEKLGILSVSRSKPFTELEMDCLEDYSNLLIYPLRNALTHQRTQEQAYQDPLTGLGNRFACNLYLSNLYEKSLHQGSAFSVLIIDLDDFKKINDTWGHVFGDKVLTFTAEKISAHAKHKGATFRHGGDEFLMVIENCTDEQAKIAAENLRKDLQHESNQACLGFSLSIGCSSLRSDDSLETLIERADQQLLKSKRAGKNRVN
jgi:diguanylate cyclase (GGDEF)-like protein